MKKEFVRNPYNYDSDQESIDTGLLCTDKSLAQQQFKEESDINFIANKFGLTGEMPQLPNGFEWGAEYDGIFNFQEAQNAVVAGKQAFMALPAKTRARFQNDPQELMDFLADPDNKHEAKKLGLLKPDIILDSNTTQGDIHAPGSKSTTGEARETETGAPRAASGRGEPQTTEKPGSKAG